MDSSEVFLATQLDILIFGLLKFEEQSIAIEPKDNVKNKMIAYQGCISVVLTFFPGAEP